VAPVAPVRSGFGVVAQSVPVLFMLIEEFFLSFLLPRLTFLGLDCGLIDHSTAALIGASSMPLGLTDHARHCYSLYSSDNFFRFLRAFLILEYTWDVQRSSSSSSVYVLRSHPHSQLVKGVSHGIPYPRYHCVCFFRTRLTTFFLLTKSQLLSLQILQALSLSNDTRHIVDKGTRTVV